MRRSTQKGGKCWQGSHGDVCTIDEIKTSKKDESNTDLFVHHHDGTVEKWNVHDFIKQFKDEIVFKKFKLLFKRDAIAARNLAIQHELEGLRLILASGASLENTIIHEIYQYFTLTGQAEDSNKLLAYKRVSQGTLLDYVHKGRVPRRQLSRELHKGLKDLEKLLNGLHLQSVYHNDIKMANILVGENDTCFLADYGSVTNVPLTCNGSKEYSSPICFIKRKIEREKDKDPEEEFTSRMQRLGIFDDLTIKVMFIFYNYHANLLFKDSSPLFLAVLTVLNDKFSLYACFCHAFRLLNTADGEDHAFKILTEKIVPIEQVRGIMTSLGTEDKKVVNKWLKTYDPAPPFDPY